MAFEATVAPALFRGNGSSGPPFIFRIITWGSECMVSKLNLIYHGLAAGAHCTAPFAAVTPPARHRPASRQRPRLLVRLSQRRPLVFSGSSFLIF